MEFNDFFFCLLIFLVQILWGLLFLAVVIVGLCSLVQRQNLFKSCAGLGLLWVWGFVTALLFTLLGLR